MLSFFKESLFAEEIAARDGFLQRRDPRGKAAVIFLILLAGLFSKNLLFVIALHGAAILTAVLSEISPLTFVKRVWFFIPLFSLFIAIPALFSFVTPGEPLWVFHAAGFSVTVTRPGVLGAALLVARVAASVSVVMLLALTTRHSDLLRVLRFFGVPSVFVTTLRMCHRYLFVLVEMIQSVFLAIQSRVGFSVAPREGRQVAAWNMAALFQRSRHLSERVYDAMVSRGYQGES